MRLGIFGGTFNPIHRCHLAIATQTRDRLSLDHILFIPAGDPPHKPAASLAPAGDRYAMVERAIASEPTFKISDLEVRRLTKSYTIETIQLLQSHYPPSTELFFIIGLDSLLEFPTWKDASRLFSLCHFVVASRPEVAFASLQGFPLLPPISPESHQALRDLDQGTRDQYELPTGSHHSLWLLRLPPCHVSASEIRDRILRGVSLSSLLPEPVESYIIERGLYKEKADLT